MSPSLASWYLPILAGLVVATADHPMAAETATVVVSARGGGDFTSIQKALDFVTLRPEKSPIILIRNGLYQEQVFIRRSHVTLVGEDRDSTRIVFAVLREEWNREHNGSDWGAGVVNIDTGTTDVTLANLTVYNNHGSLYGTHRKHQFAVRGNGTRVMLLHCNVISDGGDALSLWNRDNGMYYHTDCTFEGWVDYVCPRGWCYIANSRFFGHNTPSASIWHDGSRDSTQKLVITDSFFDGVSGFPLGRNHLDAQIFLISCSFSANMADRPFYRPPSSPRPWKWGDRHYFFNCHRDGGDYEWFKDNVTTVKGLSDPRMITAKWTFDGRWDPEAMLPSVLPFASLPSPKNRANNVSTHGTTLRWIAGRGAVSHVVRFGEADPPPVMSSTMEPRLEAPGLRASATYYWSVDEVTGSDTIRGMVWKFVTASDGTAGPGKE